MSRITLAFRCFFGLLLSGKLPARASEYLPPTAPALPASTDDGAAKDAAKAKDAKAKDAKANDADGDRPSDTASARPAPRPRPQNLGEHHRDGALALLALLQREGRLIDFLRESLDDYDDADIGAAVRDIHRGCAKVIADHLTLEPVMPGDEDDAVDIPAGFDPAEVRLVGEAEGKPPFHGVLRHHGWRATSASFPTLSEGVDRHVLAPAEVEVNAAGAGS